MYKMALDERKVCSNFLQALCRTNDVFLNIFTKLFLGGSGDRISQDRNNFLQKVETITKFDTRSEFSFCTR
jgi:hypothetical protein